MGMYDYLGDYQIKIFNVPIFYELEIYGGLGTMGGSLFSYDKGEDLPLQTLWYKYPKNFTILDEDAYEGYSDESKQVVHIIKEGKYFDTILLEDFDEKDIGQKVYNYYGVLLNVKSKQDMYNHIKLKEELEFKQDELEKLYFPEGSHYCIIKDIETYDRLFPEYNIKLEELNSEFKYKLYLKEDYEDEMTLGSYLDVCIHAFNESDKEYDKFKNYKEYYNLVKEATKKFISTLSEGYVDSYFDWVGNYCNDEHKKLIKNFIEKEIMESI